MDFNTIDHCCCFTGHKMWVSTLLITTVVVLQATMWIITLLITAVVYRYYEGFNTIDHCCLLKTLYGFQLY